MSWYAAVPPRLGTVDGAGWCLRFAQSFFGAPAMYESAWQAWLATQAKYSPSDPLPGVPVILWFEHWGTYGSPPRYGNWGHVAVYVPGDAIYTSPAWGWGQGRYGTIAEIERTFNAKYVGWTPDINGLLVAGFNSSTKPVNPITPVIPDTPEEENMNIYFTASNDSSSGRIVAGTIKIGGVTRSNVWERSPDGSTRRLFDLEWKAIDQAYAAMGRKITTVPASGNTIEQMVFGRAQ